MVTGPSLCSLKCRLQAAHLLITLSAAGLAWQWDWFSRNHQQHQHDDENQEHRDQLAIWILHHGLSHWCVASTLVFYERCLSLCAGGHSLLAIPCHSIPDSGLANFCRLDLEGQKVFCLLMMLDRAQRIASTFPILVASFQPCHVFCPRTLLITVGLGPIQSFISQ